MGHYQKDCLKRRQWFKKKGKCLIKGFVSVCFESNLTEVPSNTWWLDSGATTHISNTMQGFLSIQTINPNEIVVPTIVEPPNNVEQQINGPLLHNEMLTNEQVVEEPQEIVLRRSQEERKFVISNDYMVYLHESDFDIGTSKDPISFSQAIKSVDSINP